MKKKKIKKIPRRTREKQHAKELKKIKKSLEKLQENFKKYHDKDDQDYKGIRYIENLFNEIKEDYYKPIKAKGAFNNNYIEYESRGGKDKKLSHEDYLDIIRPYLRDIINNHKALIELKDPNNTTIDDDFSGEWKTQLAMQITFISSLDTREVCITDWKSDNVEIMNASEADDLLKNFFNLLTKNISKKIRNKNKRESICFWTCWFIVL